jgi:hypothetical protein
MKTIASETGVQKCWNKVPDYAYGALQPLGSAAERMAMEIRPCHKDIAKQSFTTAPRWF